MRLKDTTKCFQNITRSFFHFKIKHMVLQYKQELQNMNHEKPLLYNVFQLKFGQVYSAGNSPLPIGGHISPGFRKERTINYHFSKGNCAILGNVLTNKKMVNKFKKKIMQTFADF